MSTRFRTQIRTRVASWVYSTPARGRTRRMYPSTSTTGYRGPSATANRSSVERSGAVSTIVGDRFNPAVSIMSAGRLGAVVVDRPTPLGVPIMTGGVFVGGVQGLKMDGACAPRLLAAAPRRVVWSVTGSGVPGSAVVAGVGSGICALTSWRGSGVAMLTAAGLPVGNVGSSAPVSSPYWLAEGRGAGYTGRFECGCGCACGRAGGSSRTRVGPTSAVGSASSGDGGAAAGDGSPKGAGYTPESCGETRPGSVAGYTGGCVDRGLGTSGGYAAEALLGVALPRRWRLRPESIIAAPVRGWSR